MKDSFKLQVTFPVKASALYHAWLDSSEHSSMTESDAVIDAAKNGKFRIWDGYITGSTVELVRNKKIVQLWRTTDFKETDRSRLTLSFEEKPGGTTLRLVHSGIPAGRGQEYKEGWQEYYFQPMKKYFSR